MMNLVPISQLDGGHIAYAAIRRHSRWFTLAGLAMLAFFIVWWQAYSWVVWVVVLLVIIRIVGWEHPASLDDDLPLDPDAHRRRRAADRHLRGVLHAGADLRRSS